MSSRHNPAYVLEHMAVLLAKDTGQELPDDFFARTKAMAKYLEEQVPWNDNKTNVPV